MTKKAEGGLKFEACEYDKVMNAFDDLRLGRCDAVCADSLVSVDYVAKEDSPFVIVWQGVPDEFFGVCLKKDNAELKANSDELETPSEKDAAKQDQNQQEQTDSKTDQHDSDDPN